MPCAKLKATAMVRAEPPTASTHPVIGFLRFRREATATPMPATAAKPSSQPAWPPSASLSSRSGPVEPPNSPPPPGPPPPPPSACGPPPPPPARLRPAGLAVEPAEAVVAEDQREDRVVARARDPGPRVRRRERD